MAIKLNRDEVDALVRNLSGLTDDPAVQSLEISRRDSLDHEYEDGFLILEYAYSDGPNHADAISEFGTTSIWTDAHRP